MGRVKRGEDGGKTTAGRLLATRDDVAEHWSSGLSRGRFDGHKNTHVVSPFSTTFRIP